MEFVTKICLIFVLAYTVDACGVPAVDPFIPDSRIVGGIPAVKHSWPWMVSLQYRGSHMCGGTLINENWVVSAAHCFEKPLSGKKRWKVLLGNHKQNAQESAEQLIGISRIINHEQYNPYTTQNDIVLLKLAKPVTLGDEVSPVCLPSASDSWREGLRCTTTGWGATQGTGSNNVLRQVTVPMISAATCGTATYYGSEYDAKSMVCAGYKEGGKDSCQGDSGGPLVCQQNGRYTLAGITSWGYGCAERNKPGVYTHVVNYASWIQSKING